MLSNIYYEQVHICGDFNFKKLNEEDNMISGGPHSEQVKFYDVCQDAFLH